jgi:hypothetical protein
MSRPESSAPDWVQRMIAAAHPLLPEGFVGRIEINVFKGGIANVNVQQSFKGELVEAR